MAKNVVSFAEALRLAGSRAARRATEPPRTRADELAAWARAHLGSRRLVLVSNREPWSHERDADGTIRAVRNAGGLAVSLDALARATGGAWVAHGSGDADRETSDAAGRVGCPPGEASYTLRRLWLDAEDHALFYASAANGALWPLCHVVFVRPRFDPRAWERYRDVNRRYAEAAIAEAGDGPALVWLHDYHLALAARTIRERRPDLGTALFWHIPWPAPEVLRVLPWRHEMLEGLLANDLIAFHTRGLALHFLHSVADTLEARVDLNQMAVDVRGHRTWVRAFPVGVPAAEIGDQTATPAVAAEAAAFRARHGLEGVKLILGVDRLDYTKGVPERLEAFARLLERRPEWRGRVAMVQVAVPSRIELPEYRAIGRRVRWLAERVNTRFPREGGRTVTLIDDALDFSRLLPLYRTADVCAVTPLHDGMNLVAKEYLAARGDLDGALVLSPFAGAANELARAHVASPYDREALAEALHAALAEPPEARRERMSALREVVLRRTVYDWAIEFLDAWMGLALRTPEATHVEGRT